MVVFHAVYDLQTLAGIDIDHNSAPWVYIGKAAALLFIFISGLSNGFSRSSALRGCKVFLLGMVVTAVTYLFFSEEYIRFGILHFLGVTMVLYPFLNRLSSGILGGLAVLAAGLGIWLKNQIFATYLLLPLGMQYAGFSTLDYYPLFPYIAVTMSGILVYRYLYAGQIQMPFPSFSGWKLTKWLSRNSLAIYLLHQPLLLLIIFSVSRWRSM